MSNFPREIISSEVIITLDEDCEGGCYRDRRPSSAWCIGQIHTYYIPFLICCVFVMGMCIPFIYPERYFKVAVVVFCFCSAVGITQFITSIVWSCIPDYESCPLTRLEDALWERRKINSMWLLQPIITFVLVLWLLSRTFYR